MTLTKDPRYDIEFVDRAGDTVVERLGLILTESGASLGFGLQRVSPYGARLSPGDVREVGMDTYVAKSQRDWSGGRGQEIALSETNRFSDSYADTRIPGMIVLPPQSVLAQFTITSYIDPLPSFTPAASGVVVAETNMFFAQSPTRQGRRYAQSFSVGGYPITLSGVQLYLAVQYIEGTPRTIHVSIQSDDGGSPSGTVVAELDNIVVNTLPTTASWHSFAMAATLSASTVYWIVLEDGGTIIEGRYGISWYGSSAEVFDEAAKYADFDNVFGYGDWTASPNAKDLFFIINGTQSTPSAPLADVTVLPVRFEGAWFAASGRRVFKWNTSTERYENVYTGAADVTAMATFNGYIWAALGDSTNMARSADGASWASVTDQKPTYLRAYNGYLYTLQKGDGTTAGILRYTADGTTWSADISVGTADFDNTCPAGFQNEIMILRTGGMSSMTADIAYQVQSYEEDEAADNGKNALAWKADGRLYIPILQGLYAYDGFRMTPVGLDLDEGLPAGEQGRVAALIGTRNWLFAVIDAGATGRSGIYAWNGRGWHALLKASAVGARIQAAGLERFTGANPRLWYFEGTTPYYVEMPDLTDNRYQFVGSRFQPAGFVVSSWLGGEIAQIEKEFRAIEMRTIGCSADVNVAVDIEVDRSGVWIPAGTATVSPWQQLLLPMSDFTATTVSAGSTASAINVASTADMSVGDFVRLGDDYGQIQTIPSATQFTLVQALDEAPAAGTSCYPARPTGREIRYRLQLFSNASASTPRVLGVTIKYQERILELARYNCSVRVEDGMADRGGGKYPYDASQLRVQLRRWVTRITPFTLLDVDGLATEVKVFSEGESGFTRQSQPQHEQRSRCVANLQLIEV